MEEWIAQLIADAVGPVRTLVDAVRARLSSLYSAFTDALGRVRSKMGQWVATGRAWELGQLRHALAVLVALKFVIHILVPGVVRQAVSDVEAWASQRVAAALALARADLAQVRAYLVDVVTDALTALAQLRRWSLAQVAAILSIIDRIEGRVFGVLATPERLAMWIMAPLIRLVLQYVMDNAGSLAEQAWRNRRAMEARALQLVDTMMDRIL